MELRLPNVKSSFAATDLSRDERRRDSKFCLTESRSAELGDERLWLKTGRMLGLYFWLREGLDEGLLHI